MRVDGLLIVDKPEGITSLDVVREVKRQLRAKRAGHIGTLDPFATGVLPVAVNEGTKLIPFLKDEPKEYEATLRLGEETTTDDATGKVTLRKPLDGLSLGSIQSVFQSFSGKIRQTPPMFSAIKKNGRRLYRLARRGLEVERAEREVEIFALQIEEVDLPEVRFKVSCSKGTYIRSLARDIGRRIGCGAHLVHLRRLRSGPFAIEQSLSWKRLGSLEDLNRGVPELIPLQKALPDLPELVGDEAMIRKIRHGREILVGELPREIPPEVKEGQWLKLLSPEEGLVAILQSELGSSDIPWASPEEVAFRPLRVFHPNDRSAEKEYS